MLLVTWEKEEERFVETSRATPASEKGGLPRKSLTSMSSGTKVQTELFLL